MPKSYRSDADVELALRDFALAYPEAVEEFPWEHRAMKVRKKVFVFLGTNEQGLFASMKLPATHPEALALPFTEPTGYGLGRHGWVSAQFGPDEIVPIDLLEAWIDESYRAVAPKTLVKELADREPSSASGSPKKKVRRRRKSTR